MSNLPTAHSDVRKLPANYHYEHEVLYPDPMGFGSRTDDGFTYRNPNKRLAADHDIVEILPTVMNRIIPQFLIIPEDACEGQLTA